MQTRVGGLQLNFGAKQALVKTNLSQKNKGKPYSVSPGRVRWGRIRNRKDTREK